MFGLISQSKNQSQWMRHKKETKNKKYDLDSKILKGTAVFTVRYSRNEMKTIEIAYTHGGLPVAFLNCDSRFFSFGRSALP